MTVNVALGIGSPLWIVIVAPKYHQGFMLRENAAVIEESQILVRSRAGPGRLENASWDGGGIEVNRELVTLLFIPQRQDHRDGCADVGSRLFDFDDQEFGRRAGFSCFEIPAWGGLGEEILHAATARRQPPGRRRRRFIGRDRYFGVALFRRWTE